jgi:hypothetical protein
MTVKFIGIEVSIWRTLFVFLLLGFSKGLSAREENAAEPRIQAFLYTSFCGQLDKFDSLTGNHLAHINLREKTKLISATACPTTGTAYNSHENIFATLALYGDPDLQQRHYRLLRFQVPDMQLLDSVPLPGTFGKNDHLDLSLSAEGTLEILTPGKDYQLEKGKLIVIPKTRKPLVPGSRAIDSFGHVFEIGLAGYDVSSLKLNPQPATLRFQPLLHSGNVVIIRREATPAWAAIDIVTKRIVALDPGFDTSEGHFVLAPGGSVILFQENGQNGETNRLALIDTEKGEVLKTWNDKDLVHGGIWAIRSSGIAILYSANPNLPDYKFHTTPLNVKMPEQALSDNGTTPHNHYFFANR